MCARVTRVKNTILFKSNNGKIKMVSGGWVSASNYYLVLSLFFIEPFLAFIFRDASISFAEQPLHAK